MFFERVAQSARRGRIAVMTLPVLVTPFFVSACASDQDIDLATYVEQTDPADVLYNQGLANMNAGRLGEASKKFSAIDRQHPYSEYGRKALVMGAFADYRQGKYDEAIAAGKRYVQLYPTDADAAYAQYIVGLSYFRQIRDVTQDQKESRRAIEAMEEVVQRWPDSQYVEDAKSKIRFARDQLAGKEMDIGRYYLDKRDYTGAINRFKVVVTKYQTTRHVEEALMRLAECYMALGVVQEAQTAAAVLGHNFPDSRWYKDAYGLVRSGGFEPREYEGSWISRAFKRIGLG